MSADSNGQFDDLTAAQRRFLSLFLRSEREVLCRVQGAVTLQGPSKPGHFGSRRRYKAFFPDCASWRARFRQVACAGLFVLGLTVQAAGIFDIRIPDEFSRVVDTNTAVLTTNATINYWLEGPVWVPGNGGYLVFSAMDANDRLKKLVPPTTVTDFLVPPANTLFNGNTLDSQERLISCQAGGAGLRVVMVTNGVVTPLVSTCAGLKFYSPNDLVVKSDGTVWFTDPGYNGGIGAPPQAGFQRGYYVYRFDPTNGNATCTPVITNLVRPNGLCFSPDESLLYVADSDTSRHHIRVYSVSSGNTLSGGSVFATVGNGIPDGIRCDVDGRVFSSSANGVWIFLPDGRLIGRIITARTVANLCFGGADWRTLFIASQPNILSIPLKVAGAVSLKKLKISQLTDSSVRVAWPWPSTGFQLQVSPTLEAGTWTPVQDNPSVSNGLNLIQFNLTNSGAFFRLCKPPL
jgi:gluconolactonase